MHSQAPETISDVVKAFRPRLIRLAYRFLGSVADAEDIVQDAFVKFSRVDEIQDPLAWLSRVVTNASLDRLRQQKSQRETYIGPWLPEPMIDPDTDASMQTELDISFAVMRALEALNPAERASLFLHDLFDQSFEDIATVLHRTPAACRQLASRARKAIRGNNKRFQASREDVNVFLEKLSQASLANDPSIMLSVLSPSADLISDGGGKVTAALNVLNGQIAVAKFLVGIVRKSMLQRFGIKPIQVNGSAGILVLREQSIDSVLAFDRDKDGLIKSVYIVRNPEKLSHVKPD